MIVGAPRCRAAEQRWAELPPPGTGEGTGGSASSGGVGGLLLCPAQEGFAPLSASFLEPCRLHGGSCAFCLFPNSARQTRGVPTAPRGLAPDSGVGRDGAARLGREPWDLEAGHPPSRMRQGTPRSATSVLAVSAWPARPAGLRVARVPGHPRTCAAGCPRLAISCLGIPEPGSANPFGWNQQAERAVSCPPLPLFQRGLGSLSPRAGCWGAAPHPRHPPRGRVRQGGGDRCLGAHRSLSSPWPLSGPWHGHTGPAPGTPAPGRQPQCHGQLQRIPFLLPDLHDRTTNADLRDTLSLKSFTFLTPSPLLPFFAINSLTWRKRSAF